MKKGEDGSVHSGEQKTKTSPVFRAISVLLLLAMVFSALVWFFVDVFVGKPKDRVAMVGGVPISVAQYRDFVDIFGFFNGFMYENEAGGGREALKKDALDAIIFNKMVHQEMKDQGFVITDDVLMSWIKLKIERGEIPFIRDMSHFRAMLDQSEKLTRYIIDEERKNLFLGLNFGAISSGYKVIDKDLLSIFMKSRREKRVVDLFTLRNLGVLDKEQPSRDELLVLYKQRQEKFRRKGGVRIRLFTSRDFARGGLPEVSTLEAIQYYNGASADKSHRRDVAILRTKSKESAQKALFMIKQKGKMIEKEDLPGEGCEIKRIQGARRKDIDSVISGEVFSYPIGQPTQVLELKDGRFAVALTEKIVAASPKKMSETEEEGVKKALAQRKFCKMVNKRIETFKTMAINNFDLKDIAGELGGVIKTIDISDDDKDNNDPTLSPDLINAARKAKLRFPDFVEIKGEPCDFVFFEAVEKLDNSPIPFHEAKDKVLEEWKKNKLDQIRKNNADSFAKKLAFYVGGAKQGSIYEIAQAVGAKVHKGVVVTRGFYDEYKEVLTQSLFDQIFMSANNSIVGPDAMEEGVYLIAVLRDIKPASPQEIGQGIKALSSDFYDQYRHDLDRSYRKFLESKYKVVIRDGYHETV